MITIKEIARLANVSIGTVDRVINKRGRVSQETRDTIEKIIQDTGYSVNIIASNLSRSKTFTIAVILPKKTQDSGYWNLLYDGMQKAETDVSKFGVFVQYFFYDRFSESSLSRTFAKVCSLKPDALVAALLIPETSVPFLEKIQNTMPIVFIDNNFPLDKKTVLYRTGLIPEWTFIRQTDEASYKQRKHCRHQVAFTGISHSSAGAGNS